jgi:hypothetical protein
LRRRDFQKAVMTREITVLRQAKLRGAAAPNHKSFVFFKRENAPRLRSCNHAQSNSHLFQLRIKEYLSVIRNS